MSYLIAPHELPDGRVVLREHVPDIQRRLNEGDATVGWAGDPRLTLVANVVDQRYEVWRNCEDGTRSIVCTRDGLHPVGPELLRRLAALDTWHADPIGDMERQQAAAERDREREWRDFSEDAGDRLHHALVKDLGEPAADGRVVGGGRR